MYASNLSYFSSSLDYTYLEVLRKPLDFISLISGEHVKLPMMTLCMGPIAKASVLQKYNMSFRALDEPNVKEKDTLRNLNKTINDLFLEATYKLGEDFFLNVTFNQYGNEGEVLIRKELHLGKNVLQV